MKGGCGRRKREKERRAGTEERMKGKEEERRQGGRANQKGRQGALRKMDGKQVCGCERKE